MDQLHFPSHCQEQGEKQGKMIFVLTKNIYDEYYTKVGDSLPSGHSKVCLTPEDVPFKNPDNVMGRGHAPNNLVISWTVSHRQIFLYSVQKELSLTFLH